MTKTYECIKCELKFDSHDAFYHETHSEWGHFIHKVNRFMRFKI